MLLNRKCVTNLLHPIVVLLIVWLLIVEANNKPTDPPTSHPTTYNPTTSTSVGFLNYLELNARRNLQMSGSQMIFRDSRSVGIGNVTSFN